MVVLPNVMCPVGMMAVKWKNSEHKCKIQMNLVSWTGKPIIPTFVPVQSLFIII